VVRDVTEEIGSTEGINAKGYFIPPDEAETEFAIIPRNFLQDDAFSAQTSHKLSRLTEW